MASRQKHDSAVMKILKDRGTSYEEWANKEIWKFFRAALMDKNSEARSLVLKHAEEMLKAKAIESYLNRNH